MKIDSSMTAQNYSNLEEGQYMNSWDSAPAICNPLLRLFGQNKSVPTLFHEMINKLSKFFSISRAVLIIRNNKNTLGAMAIWNNFQFQNGLTLTLPRKNSFLYETLKNGKIKSLPIFSNAPGNVIENKILINKSDSALTVCPMISEDSIRGLVSLASPVPYAFELIEEGCLEPVFEALGRVLSNKYDKINREINKKKELG